MAESASSYQPAPFFVLDEVDAALDNTNVAKIANYIRNQASDKFQFIVISLKGSLYERGNSLVGIYRDQDKNSSSALTLDVRKFCSVRGSIILMCGFLTAHSIRRIVNYITTLSLSKPGPLLSMYSCNIIA